MKKSLLTQLVAVMTLNLGAAGVAFADRDPVGEGAHYEVDRTSGRTSSMVQSGTLDASITQHQPDDASYEMKLDYNFKIRIIGNRSGSQAIAVPDAYFTPEFMVELRQSGEYSSPKFKVRHLGYGDARTLDGHTYENCDKVLISDVSMGYWSEVANALLLPADANLRGESIQDLEITAYVKEGMPVLGAVKLDIAGKYNGINIKAGADYQAQ